MEPRRAVLLEKTFAAESRLTGVRLFVIAVNTLGYWLAMDHANSNPPLAYSVIAVAWIYGLYVLIWQPYRHFPVLLSSYFTTFSDAALIMVWIHATGGWASPFYLVIYASLVAVAFRYQPLETAVAAVVYTGGYLLMLAARGELSGHTADLLIRAGYFAVFSILGAVFSHELLKETAERARMREQLRTEELRHRLLEEQAGRTAAELAIHARDDFLSVASHEMNTPLTALKLEVQRALAEEQAGATDTRARLQKIERQIRRLTNLVGELLDVSRITAGRLHIELEPVDLTGVVREAAVRFKSQFERADSLLTVKAVPSLIGDWDRMRLEQVVDNLLSNALKYGEGNPIEIEVRNENASALLSVRDRGIGIAKDDQARIFERFERAVSNRSVGGLGLGLWIVRRVVEAKGGEIYVESQLNQGSTFIVKLPLERSAHAPLG